MMRVGIVAALPGELAPLTHGWGHAGDVSIGTGDVSIGTGDVSIGQITLPDGAPAAVYAIAAGMGPASATRGFAQVQAAAGNLDAVVSYGWAGALSCGVKPPDVFQLSEVIDSRTGERFFSSASPQANALRLVTLDHVARANEKRPLAERYQAVLVDMEAATIARLARAHGIPFLCLKAISDGYTDVLPDFNRFLDHAGQLRLPPFVIHALLRPRYWAPLARLGVNSRRAALNLAAQLPACLAGAGLLSCMP